MKILTFCKALRPLLPTFTFVQQYKPNITLVHNFFEMQMNLWILIVVSNTQFAFCSRLFVYSYKRLVFNYIVLRLMDEFQEERKLKILYDCAKNSKLTRIFFTLNMETWQRHFNRNILNKVQFDVREQLFSALFFQTIESNL